MELQSLAITENIDEGVANESRLIAATSPAIQGPFPPNEGQVIDHFELVKVKPDGTYVTPTPPSPSRFTSDGKFKLKWPTFTKKNASTSTESNESGVELSPSNASTQAQCSSMSDSPSTDKDYSPDKWGIVRVNPDGSFTTPPQSPESAKRPILSWRFKKNKSVP